MTVLKAINVDSDVFTEFKALAVINDVTIGKMLEILIQNYKQSKEDNKTNG